MRYQGAEFLSENTIHVQCKWFALRPSDCFGCGYHFCYGFLVLFLGRAFCLLSCFVFSVMRRRKLVPGLKQTVAPQKSYSKIMKAMEIERKKGRRTSLFFSSCARHFLHLFLPCNEQERVGSRTKTTHTGTKRIRRTVRKNKLSRRKKKVKQKCRRSRS